MRARDPSRSLHAGDDRSIETGGSGEPLKCKRKEKEVEEEIVGMK